MRKRLVFSIFGFGVVYAVIKAVAREIRKLVAQDSAEEYWHWLSVVWEDYTVLDGYVRDKRTFGNSVWDDEVLKALTSLEHRLQHYPKEQLRSFGGDFERESSRLLEQAFLHLMQIKKSYLRNDKNGLVGPNDFFGEVLTELNHLGDEVRKERMLYGIR